jgi:hypothetical protein
MIFTFSHKTFAVNLYIFVRRGIPYREESDVEYEGTTCMYVLTCVVQEGVQQREKDASWGGL